MMVIEEESGVKEVGCLRGKREQRKRIFSGTNLGKGRNKRDEKRRNFLTIDFKLKRSNDVN